MVTQRTLARVLMAAALLVVGVLAVVVWPTAYRDLPLRAGSRTILAARQQRFTGTVEVLTLAGWHRLVPADTAPEDPLVARMRALSGAPR